MTIELIDLTENDYQKVKEIYDHFIRNSTATFHTEELSISELKEFIYTDHPRYKSFLIYTDNKLCGFCYLSPFKPRQAYNRTAELTIYLRPEYQGKGIGAAVVKQLESVARNSDISILIGVISGGNHASERLFKKSGYEKCAHFKQVGEKFDQIIDVVAYQKILTN